MKSLLPFGGSNLLQVWSRDPSLLPRVQVEDEGGPQCFDQAKGKRALEVDGVSWAGGECKELGCTIAELSGCERRFGTELYFGT
jgi:hypothetical protein